MKSNKVTISVYLFGVGFELLFLKYKLILVNITFGQPLTLNDFLVKFN